MRGNWIYNGLLIWITDITLAQITDQLNQLPNPQLGPEQMLFKV